VQHLLSDLVYFSLTKFQALMLLFLLLPKSTDYRYKAML